MGALQGLGVLVTRPRLQAAPLCRLLESHGALTVCLPAIDIHPLEGGEAGGAAPPVGEFDLAIFTSANAVRHGAHLLRSQPVAALAAIGPATARALGELGFAVGVTASGGFDSERLLQTRELTNVKGLRILIVKGLSGRDLLRDSLVERGADVTVAAVYRRSCTAHPPDVLATITRRMAGGDIHVITALSVDVVDCMLAAAPADMRRAFDRLAWVVPGPRVARAVRDRGVTAVLLEADTAEDHALVRTLLRWRSPASQA